MDSDHDGCVSFAELLAFAEFCNDRRRQLGGWGALKSQCVVDMWEAVSNDRGEEDFADWMIKLVLQGDQYHYSDQSPNVRFMSRDAVMTLYELLVPLQVSSSPRSF